MHSLCLNVLKICFVMLLCYANAETSYAQKRFAQITLTSSDHDGIIETNRPVTLTASIKNKLDEVINGTVVWSANSPCFQSLPPVHQAITLRRQQTIAHTFCFSMPCAGFAEIKCQLVTSKNEKTVSARCRIGSHVEDIACPLTREADFFNFWEESLAQLASTAPNFQLRPNKQQSQSQSKVSVFEVSMQSFDNICVRGWLEIPNQDGLFPSVLRVPGYGQNMKPVGNQEDLIVFSFNPRGHGNSQDDISGKPEDYWVRGLDDRNTYFYRGAYLDCVRAVDFLCTLDKVDQQKIAVWGASQGGGFAFATAALDNRIDLCVADIPFLCNWENYFKLTHWDEMDDWLNKKKHRSWAHTLKTMSYFDTMNLCDRVTCKTIMNVGLQDQICPPTTSFAAFNRVRGTKTYKIYPARGHGLGKEHRQSTWKQIKSFFLPNKTSTR